MRQAHKLVGNISEAASESSSSIDIAVFVVTAPHCRRIVVARAPTCVSIGARAKSSDGLGRDGRALWFVIVVV